MTPEIKAPFSVFQMSKLNLFKAEECVSSNSWWVTSPILLIPSPDIFQGTRVALKRIHPAYKYRALWPEIEYVQKSKSTRTNAWENQLQACVFWSCWTREGLNSERFRKAVQRLKSSWKGGYRLAGKKKESWNEHLPLRLLRHSYCHETNFPVCLPE